MEERGNRVGKTEDRGVGNLPVLGQQLENWHTLTVQFYPAALKAKLFNSGEVILVQRDNRYPSVQVA